MTRLLGFLIEGIAANREFTIALVVPDHIRDIAEADLRMLSAEPGRDFTIHSPRDAGMSAEGFEKIADFANRHVPVEAWLTLFPTYTHASLLDAPVTTIFPDAIPAIFPEFTDAAWCDSGDAVRWRRSVESVLEHATRVITFSDHVSRGQTQRLFGVPKDKIVTIPHAGPDLSSLLDLPGFGVRSEESVGCAADLLRRHARARCWTYLHDFPFEEVPFIVVSTQDRVTKNLQLIPRAMEIILDEHRSDAKAFMTAAMHSSSWTGLWPQVRGGSSFDVVSVPDLPREEHAALLHCAAVAVHPAIFEGGHAPFPFSEAVSVGTPCLMARGPHVAEIATGEPELLEFTFDANDPDRLAAMILDTFARRDAVYAAQRAVYDRLPHVHWSDVAAAYARAAVGEGAKI